MANEQNLTIPTAWEQLDLASTPGVVMIVGAPNTGKTTFARYLFHRWSGTAKGRIAFLDGDPGQSHLGLPTTLALAFDLDESGDGGHWMYFVGSVSPRGHMLVTLVGAARLAQAASQAADQTVIYDTSGLVDPAQGGLALKSAEIDMLRPKAVIAIQNEQELEPLLAPLRRSRRTRVLSLQPSPAARRRDIAERQSHRAARFAAHFSRAKHMLVDWTSLAVFPMPRFSMHRLVAYENKEGFTLALGIVTRIERQARQVEILTPLASLDGVNALRLGDVVVDPGTFRDEKLGGNLHW